MRYDPALLKWDRLYLSFLMFRFFGSDGIARSQQSITLTFPLPRKRASESEKSAISVWQKRFDA